MGGHDVRPQRLVVQRVELSKVDYVEPDLLAVVIFYSKIIPLHMSFCIGIYPHEKIVLILAHLDSCIQIAALKCAIEDGYLA